MKIEIHSILVTFLACVFLTACGSSTAAPATTLTQNPTSLVASLASTSTSSPEPTSTAPSTPTETPLPTATPNQTATAEAASQLARSATQQAAQTATEASALATQQVEDAIWAKLVDDDLVNFNQGFRYSVDDFNESWAQRNWYKWWPFSYILSDFVIMTYIDWETAEASYGNGGCGFVFRIKDDNQHLVIFLTPKGDAQFGSMNYKGFTYQTIHWKNPNLPIYSSMTPPTSGSADFIVVAENDFITAYVDGIKIYQWYVALTTPGDMGYTILSGTNKDFGTSCKFSNTRVWELIP